MISRADYETAREVLTGRPRQIARIGGRSFRTLESLDRFAIKEGLEDGGIVPTNYDDPSLREAVVVGEYGAEIFVEDSSKFGKPADEVSETPKPKAKRAPARRKPKAKSQEAGEKPARRTRKAAQPADEVSETPESPPEP